MKNSMDGALEPTKASEAFGRDDEIDLFDLIDDIWAHKIWVVAGLLLSVLVAAVYLGKTTPIYQVDAKVKSATANDLIEFSRPQLAEIFTLDVGGAFAAAKSALLSTGYRKEFYDLKLEEIKAVPDFFDEQLSLEQNFLAFSRKFSVTASGAKDTEAHVKLSLKSSSPTVSAELLNEFIEYALFRRLRDTYDTMLAKVNGRIEALNYRANMMREEYLGDKAKRILELKEAAVIAVAIGQVDPIYRSIDLMGGQEPPLYMLGSKAIRAEIKALEARYKSATDLPRKEDHFIEGLPSILLEIDELKKLRVDFSKVHLAKVDEVAVVPLSPIKPKKLLIMALAVVAGSFVGLFMALVVAAYSKRKARIKVS